jgi:hypothetical protein
MSMATMMRAIKFAQGNTAFAVHVASNRVPMESASAAAELDSRPWARYRYESPKPIVSRHCGSAHAAAWMGCDYAKQPPTRGAVDRYRPIEQPEGRGQRDKEKCHGRPGLGASTRELRSSVTAWCISSPFPPPVLSDRASWGLVIDLEPQLVGDWSLIAGWVFIAHAADELAESTEIGGTSDRDLPRHNWCQPA